MRKFNNRKSSLKAESNHNQQQSNHHHHIIDKNSIANMSEKHQIQLIQSTYHQIALSPQNQIKSIQNIFSLVKVDNLRVVCYALSTLSTLFVTISPTEPINLTDIQSRLNTKITKQQFKIISFQKILIQHYQRYLKILKQLNNKIKKSSFENDMQLYKEFKRCILNCSIKLLQTLWNFNFIKQLLQLLIKFIHQQNCYQTLKKFLMDKNISTITLKSQIIKCISKLIAKKDDQNLPQNLVQLINSTYIDPRYLEKNKQSLNYKKKQLKKKLYKQQAFQRKKEKEKRIEKGNGNGTLQMKRKKKQQKLVQKLKVKLQVEKQFAQAEAQISNKLVVKHTSFILQEVFYIYFKILVENPKSKFLRSTLDGILLFSHMINIELIFSLVQHLNIAAQTFRLYWNQNKQNQLLQRRILIIFTSESVINGPLSIFNMDDLNQTNNFFKVFKDINSNPQITITKQIYRLIIITCQQLFIKRRQLSQQIVASFLRQIVIFTSRQNIPKILLLDLVRLLISKYSKTLRMLEIDNQGFGLNSFNQKCQDPQSTNAINTSILDILKKIQKTASNYQKVRVKQYIDSFAKQQIQHLSKNKLKFEDMFQQDLGYFQFTKNAF